MKLLAIAVALHALAAAATKKWEIANTTRATLPCAKTYHDKPTPFMYQESVLFLNFSQVGLPPVNESNKGYSVDRWWGRHHILRKSIVSNRGIKGRDSLLHKCMAACLKNEQCASLAVVDAFDTLPHKGISECYMYDRPFNVGKNHIVKSKPEAETRVVWAYNLVCAEEQQKWIEDQEPAKKKAAEEKAKKKAEEEQKAKEKHEADLLYGKQNKAKADTLSAAKEAEAEIHRLQELGREDEKQRKKVIATPTLYPTSA